jgi:hypothetical protein
LQRTYAYMLSRNSVKTNIHIQPMTTKTHAQGPHGCLTCKQKVSIKYSRSSAPSQQLGLSVPAVFDAMTEHSCPQCIWVLKADVFTFKDFLLVQRRME